MNITYTQNGDYLIPNIVIRKTKPLGHYGRLRKAYLEMHRPILFNELVLSDNGKLESNKRMWLYEKIHISILGNRVSVTYSKEV